MNSQYKKQFGITLKDAKAKVIFAFGRLPRPGHEVQVRKYPDHVTLQGIRYTPLLHGIRTVYLVNNSGKYSLRSHFSAN